MSSLELKGGILEVVSNIQDEAVLSRLYQLVKEFIQTENIVEQLSPEQSEELNIALAEADSEHAEWVEHQEVIKIISL